MTCNLYCTECLKTQPFQVSDQSFVCPTCAKHLCRTRDPAAQIIHRLPDANLGGAAPRGA